MKRSLALTAALLLLCAAQPALADAPVVALVASSAAEAMGEIIPLYEKAHPGTTITPNYGGAQVLRAQIESGAAVDMIIVGNSTIKALGAKLDAPVGLYRYSEAVLVPKGSSKVHGLKDLANKGVQVALGTATAPHGMYAREVLAKAAKSYGAGFEAAVMANVTLQKPAAAGIPAAVASGAVDAGIGFTADASDKITAIAIPAELNVVTETFGAAVHGAPHEAAAKAFTDFLAGSEAQAIFRKHHFDTLH